MRRRLCSWESRGSRALVVGLCSWMVLNTGCLRTSFDGSLGAEGLGEPEDTTGDAGTLSAGTSASGESGPTSATTTGPEPTPLEKIDILFVVDNSAGTALEQRRMARALQLLGEFLDSEVADWRVAVTTSDNGNPWCGGTTPEGGALVNRSCRDRLGDFIDQTGTIDATAHACTDLCPYDTNNLGLQGSWVERSYGEPNFNPAFSASEVLPCVLPQGINGCGFESQLESMYKAELRSRTESDAAFGFFREDAAKAIVLLTDELDCSYNAQWSAIFTDEGGKVFWTDTSMGYPTSGMCFNAGTVCTAADFESFDCQAADRNMWGDLLTPDQSEDAVLHPVERYASTLEDLEDSVKQFHPEAELGLAVFGGYDLEGGLYFPYPPTGEFQVNYGVGPACTRVGPGLTSCVTDAQCGVLGLGPCQEGFCVEEETAISPARMAELAERLDQGSGLQYSSCHEDYSEPLFEFILGLLDL